MRYRVILGLTAILAILISSSSFAVEPYALHARKAVLRELTAKERKILKQLKEISDEINHKSAGIELLDEEIARKELILRRLSLKLAQKEKFLNELEKRFQERIKHLATTGKLGWINLILSPKEISSFFRRQEYAYLILYHDKQLAQKIKEEREALEYQKKILQEEMARLEKLKQRYQQQLLALEELKREKETLLEEVQRNKRLYGETLRMLKSAYDAISKMAAELERTREELEVTKKEVLETQRNKVEQDKKPPKTVPLLELKGLLPPPIEGEVVEYFGLEVDPLTGEKIFHSGITIAAPVGTPVKAPYAGEIVKISIVQSKGTLVFIDHGYHFLSVIGGLGKVTKGLGDYVSTGEIIGEVGETPYGRGGVYYELRYKGKPQNPLDWLDTSKLKFFR
ncbi:MAG: peptidoglycan DD-metalloendopeptidase family protein [Thermodesulfobacteria bacterium]|nr:peptidoglycan DD-metalloendopeptidase family protein [Thermodesulfobacteriota bacterium]